MAQKEKGLLYRFIRKLLIFIISLGIVISSVYMGVNFVYSKYIMPVDSNNTELVEIEIPRDSSLDAISQILYDNNLIRSKTAFKLYVDVSNKTSQLKAGKYKLSRNMELGQIMDELLAGNAASDTVTITIIEGWDIRKLLDI